MKIHKAAIFVIVTFFITLGLMPCASAVILTSITIDPENETGQTTNAPGAWSTNRSDPLSQLAVKLADGSYANEGSAYGDMGAIAISLEPGIHVLTLVGNGVFPYNEHYGAVLFFDGVATPPQIAVYNQNGAMGGFEVQPEGTTIMGGADGGLFFDVAPGTNVYTAEDGTRVEVLGWVINSLASDTDEVSYGQIGSDGTPDTTCQLILKVIAPDTVSGCIALKNTALIGSRVVLIQQGENIQQGVTDSNGCYRFHEIVEGKKFRVSILGPVVP